MATDGAKPDATAQSARLNFEGSKTSADWVALLSDEANPPLGEDVAAILKCLPSDPVDMPAIIKIFENEEYNAKILRMVNDVYFNPAEPFLANTHRATIILGFRTLRSLGLSVALLSYLLKNSPDDSFMQEVASAIQTATLASFIAKKRVRSINCEPVFTAALLMTLGRLIFMSFGGSNAKKYCELTANTEASEEEELNIVGFLLKDFTRDLGKKWFIGPTLLKALDGAKDDEIVQIILLSVKTVQSLKEGWESDTTQLMFKELSAFLNITFAQSKNLVLESTLRSLESASLYSPRVLDYVYLAEKAETVDVYDPDSPKEESKLNPSRVTASIQEMSILLGSQSTPSMSDLLVVGLRSIRNCLDLDRVIFSLLNQDKLTLKGKSIDEKKNSGLFSDFKFELNAAEGWLFQYMLKEGRPAWVGHKEEISLAKLRNAALNSKLGKGGFFIAPFSLQGSIMGFYYADRQVTGRSLDEQSFAAFKEMCTTINGFIELVMMRAKAKK